MTEQDDFQKSAELRRRIIVRAKMYTYGFLAAALAIAFGGSAMVAWILSRTGLPFVKTWIAILIIVLLPSLVTVVWRAVRERSQP
jgi:FtsH-binding integral membrane protein